MIEPPHFICVESIEKSPQVVKHVIKGEKWTCITPKAGGDERSWFKISRDFTVEKGRKLWYNKVSKFRR